MKSTVEFKVRGYHLDLYSHVNNARYVEFLEEGRWAAFEESKAAAAIAARGYAFIVVNINISYLAPAVLHDVLVLETSIKVIGNKSITLSQKMSRKTAGTPVVDADVKFVFMDTQTGKAVEINEIRRLLEE